MGICKRLQQECSAQPTRGPASGRRLESNGRAPAPASRNAESANSGAGAPLSHEQPDETSHAVASGFKVVRERTRELSPPTPSALIAWMAVSRRRAPHPRMTGELHPPGLAKGWIAGVGASRQRPPSAKARISMRTCAKTRATAKFLQKQYHGLLHRYLER